MISGVEKVIYLHLHNTKATVACFAVFMPCRQIYSNFKAGMPTPKFVFRDNQEQNQGQIHEIRDMSKTWLDS